MGNQRTSQLQLDEAGRSMFGHNWRGVFASEEPLPLTGYCLVNTGTRKSGGEHWLAHGRGVWYDSFGRSKYGDDSGDAEQRTDEYNCGQRCLAWLSVLHLYGAPVAMLI